MTKHIRRARNPKPDAPEGVVALVQFIIGHWKMITTAIAALTAVWYFSEGVLSARELIILRPEALALHNQQATEIAQAKAGIDYFTQARISALNREIGSIHERIRQGKATALDIANLKSYEEEVKALQQRGK